MTKFIFGLNTALDLAQVENKPLALRNLGIEIRDLDVIRGLSDFGVSATDFRNLSGLDLDFKKELKRLSEGTATYRFLLSELPDNTDAYDTSLFTSGKIGAKAIRYNYLDFSDNTVKAADISTSRLSVWSSFDETITATSPIFYGSSLEIIEDGTGSGNLRTTEISFSDEPIPLEFASETATHLVTMNINGVPTEFYAMKGIPLEFDAFFRNGSFNITVNKLAGAPDPSWKIIDLDAGGVIRRFTDVAVNFTGTIQDSSAKPRRMQFFYNPDRITEISMSNLQINGFDVPTMPLLDLANLNFNDLKSLPNFLILAPALRTLNIIGNNLTRTSESMNTQIVRLPSSLLRFRADGCFSDGDFVDTRTALPNLQIFSHNANFTSRNARAMTHAGSTPAVASSIREYYVAGHRYQSLHESLSTASSLQRINISNNQIVSLNTDAEISFTSPDLIEFISNYGNRHNVVNVSGKTNLVRYLHRYARNLVGSSTIENKFANCSSLAEINLYACDATGSITEAFRDLGSLVTLDIRYTRLTGNIAQNTFSGTTNLRNLLIGGGLFDSEQFFEEESMFNIPDIRTLVTVSNRNIKGTLPDFSRNRNIVTIYMSSVGLTGPIPDFNSNPSLRTLVLINGRTDTLSGFTGAMPTLKSNQLVNVNLSNNSLVSNNTDTPFPVLECSSLTTLTLFNNLFSGRIGDFSRCTALVTLNLGNNQFNSYVQGSLSLCTKLRDLNLVNNELTLNAVTLLLTDLIENYNQNNRSGVSVNLLGNRFTISEVESDSTTKNAIDFLRSQGWNILY